MKKQILLLAAMALVLAACSGEKAEAPAEKYFSGMFMYGADAAIFRDCATALRCPVAMREEYIEAERTYMSMGLEPMQEVLIEFKGDIALETDPEAGARLVVTIKEFVGMDDETGCNWNYVIPGLYEAQDTETRTVLRLKPDYTYSKSVYTDPISPEETSGIWYRSAAMELITVESGSDNVWHGFEIIPAQESIVSNTKGKPLAYKKVYL